MRTTVPCVRTLVLICAFLSISFSSFSQSITSGNGKVEYGITVGPMFFLGDLGGNYGTGKTFLKDLNLPTVTLSKGLFLNIYPTEWLGFRLAANHGVVEAADSLIDNKGGDEYFRYKRNLHFKSQIFEAYGAVEFYPTVFFEQYDGLAGKIRPYGVIGFGMFKYNPKAKYYEASGRERWVALQPLRLEGQGMEEYADRKEYKLTSFEVPMGFGLKYYFSDNRYIGFEVLHRTTFTDYIDDVSTNYIDQRLFDKYLQGENRRIARQLYYRENAVTPQSRPMPALDEQRGDPKENDAFFTSVLRFGWRLNDRNSPASRASRQLRCPTYY